MQDILECCCGLNIHKESYSCLPSQMNNEGNGEKQVSINKDNPYIKYILCKVSWIK